MKLISLIRKEGKTPFDYIVKVGCGPNFVLNRQRVFERMILEQGTTYWFRFWLTFCFNPGCHYLNKIKEQTPELMDAANIYIHKNFLQGSSLESCRYCVNVIKVMCSTQTKSMNKQSKREESTNSSLQELVINYLEMVFGAALCEIFYKWLANENLEYGDYWILPAEYLNPNFEPGLLEEYLVCAWGDTLYLLLDDPERMIGWVRTLLSEMKSGGVVNAILEENFKNLERLKFMKELAQIMKVRRQERINEIIAVDETQNEIHNPLMFLAAQNQKNNNKRDVKLRNLKKFIPIEKKKSPHHCAYCIAVESETAPFKMCKQCVDEQWAEPRYYCCVSCQIEHWFKKHQKEHFEFMHNKLYTSKTIKPASIPSGMKNYVINGLFAIILILSFRSVFNCLLLISKAYLEFPFN